jgi:hypothetical protein
MVKDVEFRPDKYAPEVARVLDLAGGGARLMPLVRTECASTETRDSVKGLAAPQSVKAGLYLYCLCWDDAHTTADAVENADGYFWHAIVHRQEPDPANSAYWFRMTGAHPIFPQLAEQAADTGYQTGRTWNPFDFIEFCEAARTRPGSDDEHLAMKVQLMEWRLLFDHCVRGLAF